MRATLMFGAGDVRVENVPYPGLRERTDCHRRNRRRRPSCDDNTATGTQIA